MTLLISDPPSPESDVTTSLFIINSRAMAAQRYIASADDGFKTEGNSLFLPQTNANQEVAPPTASAALGEALLEIKCDTEEQSFNTASPRFRLRGSTCVTPGAESLTTQVQNKTNGYVATVFHRSPQTFTTDYINLNEGQNQIAVRFDTEGGTVQKTITVVRSPASHN